MECEVLGKSMDFEYLELGSFKNMRAQKPIEKIFMNPQAPACSIWGLGTKITLLNELSFLSGTCVEPCEKGNARKQRKSICEDSANCRPVRGPSWISWTPAPVWLSAPCLSCLVLLPQFLIFWFVLDSRGLPCSLFKVGQKNHNTNPHYPPRTPPA